MPGLKPLAQSFVRELYLIGTHHTYQYGVGSTYANGCTAEEETAFRAQVTARIKQLGLRAVAEELNEDGLSEHGVCRSVLQDLAGGIGLRHCFCEPSRAERIALGVQTENDLRVSAWINDWPQSEVQERMLGEFRKRERVWCDRIQQLDVWPLLFVCGANHVETFSSLLQERSISVYLLEKCWECPSNAREVTNTSHRSATECGWCSNH